jgi:hypothetical protein
MMPSNGPQGTVIFFPYVGSTPLLGPDEWISIAAKVLNAVVMLVLLCAITRLCCYTIQQRRVDHSITAERLNLLSTRWLNTLGGHPTDAEAKVASGAAEKKSDSVISSDHAEGRKMSANSESKTMGECSSAASPAGSDSPSPYRQPPRTGTDLLKMGLWRRFSHKEVDLSLPPPDYVLYEPKFEELNNAYDLLKATTTCPDKKSRHWWVSIVKIWFFLPFWCFELLLYLFIQTRHPFWPAVLLAITSHAHNLRFGTTLSYLKVLRLSIQHPLYGTAKSKDIVLASRIILSTEPNVRPSKKWWVSVAWFTLGTCSVLVIGTELTIQWNGIKGVQNLSSIGQLIPFTLGVGGLIKVVYTAVTERETRETDEWCYYARCSKDSRNKKEAWKEASETFMRCRETLRKKTASVQTEDKSTDEKC